MSDIFGRTDSGFAGAFSADFSKLYLGAFNPAAIDGDATASLVQNLQLNYQQQVNQIFEVGSSRRYYVVGRTQGSLGFGRVVGPSVVALTLLESLGQVCNAADAHKLSFQLGSSACMVDGTPLPRPGGAAGAAAVKPAAIFIDADAVVATSVGYSVQAQDMLINENIQCQTGQISRRVEALAG